MLDLQKVLIDILNINLKKTAELKKKVFWAFFFNMCSFSLLAYLLFNLHNTSIGEKYQKELQIDKDWNSKVNTCHMFIESYRPQLSQNVMI